ncbi:2537_t:CDS:2 [Ambispora leptoticha]|uniref:Thioredoxin reductase n=1 Tax=Ambispora leptoticha TaxID=144679 RepID=A0A9N9AAP4_9GLOM|nr:2537_t:CDS:2 [Ambispora leptoticha]
MSLFSRFTLAVRPNNQHVLSRLLTVQRNMHSKVVIIGSGPAGHTAALYLSRATLEPVMFEGLFANGFAPGGQLTTTTDVENYPGFPEGIMGGEMMDKFREQSIRFGTKIITETVSKVDLSTRPFKFWRENHEDKEPDTADSLIIATGAAAKRLNLPGEEIYWQKGISACAVCDGALPIFRNKPLAVVGGGDSAAEEATFLTKFGSHVFVLVRRDKLRASKVMANRLLSNPNITVLWNTIAIECKGDGNVLNLLITKNTKTGEIKDLPINGLFYAIGHVPATDLVKGQLKLDSDGYVITEPDSTCTSVDGVFAAGDVKDKRYRQAVTSAGSGCMAALECERWLSEHLPE